MSDTKVFIQIAVYFNGDVIQKSSFPVREILIGRSNDCDIILDNAGVSRHHAKIAVLDDQLQVSDLESGNGTFINNEAISTAQLGATDNLRIAKFTVKAELTEKPEDDTPTALQSNNVIEQNAHQTVFLSPEERQQILNHKPNQRPKASATSHSYSERTTSAKSQTPWLYFVGGLAVGLIVYWLVSLF